ENWLAPQSRTKTEGDLSLIITGNT
ncbi:unnamed protein product, partial [Allacma fusca]